MSVRGLGWTIVVCSILMISGYASAAQQNTSYLRLSGGYSMVQDADTMIFCWDLISNSSLKTVMAEPWPWVGASVA